ncbi:PE-PGRS family protein [Catenulispora sp. MAP12-49]|uniref:PE-PGRS family protein n=1 Tax=Catenulispora sp. MAP12-49 TaxID=3156302 RepID=UPI003516E2C1
MTDEMDLLTAVEKLDDFLRTAPLTEAVATLERTLEGADRAGVTQAAASAGITAELLAAAVIVRARLGRINDLVHAAGIVLALPSLLEDGERIITRPSLAAGNDPTRPYDLHTDLRAAEFKFSQWKGADSMRKRQTFKDFVLLAASDAPRAELLVIGPGPGHFLRSCTSTASWGLDRAKGARAVFEDKFGTLDTTIAQFTATHGAHVTITDICTLLPGQVAALLLR